MCDVCDTTLFNMHWVCHKCGFVVCLDCYKVRLRALQQDSGDEGDESDPYNGVQQEEQRDWLTCSANRQQHEPDKLMLTQIIPGDALWEVGKLIHDMKKKWSIPCKCSCGQSNSKLVQKNGISQVTEINTEFCMTSDHLVWGWSSVGDCQTHDSSYIIGNHTVRKSFLQLEKDGRSE
jgi:lysine-specific demethylase 3